MARKSTRQSFGSIRKLPSGRFQARYFTPSGERVPAPSTFHDELSAQAWLAAERRHLEDPAAYTTPAERVTAARSRAEAAKLPTFAEYAETWLRSRKVKGQPLQPSTARAYRVFLNRYLLPAFGPLPVDQITPAQVVRWYEGMDPGKPKTLRESYALGKAILRTATAADGVLPGGVNPFAIDGAGSIGAKSDKRTELVEDEDLPVILSTIRPEWRAMVLVALGCGLRFGELAALRRSDVDMKAGVIRVRRAVGTGEGGKRYEKPPKSRAGIRDQRIPAAIVDGLTEHLRTYVTGRDGLLFPGPGGEWLRHDRFYEAKGGWHDVREALGRPVNFHDLRASGATRLARATANIAEVQAFLGDSSPDAAERYVRATQSRMDDLTLVAFQSLHVALTIPTEAKA